MEIAVELETPVNSDMSKFMARAETLYKSGADIVTMADSPFGRSRLDTGMAAIKVKREIGGKTLPHITCRDRNAVAIKAWLLGVNAEGISDVLAVTGDPIGEEDGDSVKSVFNFNAVELAAFINKLNNDIFIENPFKIYAALNVNAVNFDNELKRAERKAEAGVSAFLTQPVFSENALRNIERAVNNLNAKIFGGVMPVVSFKNALFLSKSVSGVDVPDYVVNAFKDLSADENFAVSVRIANEMAANIARVTKNFYIITTLNKLEIVTEIIKTIKYKGDTK